VEKRRQPAGCAGGDQGAESLRCRERLERAEQQERPANQSENAKRAGRRVAHGGQPPGSVTAHAEAVGGVGRRILVQSSRDHDESNHRDCRTRTAPEQWLARDRLDAVLSAWLRRAQPCDGCALALKASCVQSGSTTDGVFRSETGERTGQRGGCRGVADPDLSEDQAVDPARRELFRQLGSGCHRGGQLLPGQGGLGGDVGRAFGDLEVADARRGFAGEPDVRDQKTVVAAGGKNAKRGFTARCGGRDLRRDDTVEPAGPMADMSVIGGAHEDAGVEARWRWPSGDLGPSLDQDFQRTEAAGGLDQSGPDGRARRSPPSGRSQCLGGRQARRRPRRCPTARA